MADKRRIAFFNSTSFWGGGEKWHFDIASALDQEIFSALIYAHPHGKLAEKTILQGIPTLPVKIGNLSFLNPFKIYSLKKSFLQNNINTIIINSPSDLKTAGLAAKKANIKNIVYRRGSAIPIKNTFINRYFFKKIITNVIANSKETKKTILKNNSALIDTDKIKIIYNGIDLEKYHFKNKKPHHKKLIIGNIGRLEKQKAHELLIDIASILKQKNIDFEMRIAGSGSKEQELRQYANSKNVEKEVMFFGFVDNIPQFLNEIELFALSSRWEGFGYGIVEAMAMKIPVIAFDISSNTEIIDHNKTGILIPCFDTEKFAESIIKLRANKNKMLSLGEKGREKVIAEFSYQNTINILQKYLIQLPEN